MLGAGPMRLFLKVGLPAARPAIAIGVILALMETLNDIGAVEYLGVRTLTFSIFDTWLNRSSLAGAAQLSLAVLVIIAGLVYAERKLRSARSYHNTQNSMLPPDLIKLNGVKAIGAAAACVIPVLLGFAVPFLQLVSFSIDNPAQASDPNLQSAFANSIIVATATSLVCVLAGFIIVYASRRSRATFFHSASQIAGLGYAIPGTILAIGVLTALTGFDNQVSSIVAGWTGKPTGLLLSGSLAIVIFACSIRFLAIAVGNIDSGYLKISPNLGSAARTLGRSESRTLLEIEMPMMAKVYGTAAILVMVETAKELSSTLLLRPFNFDTLSTYIYTRASRAVFEQASLAALLIVLIGLVPVYLLTRVLISRQNSQPKKMADLRGPPVELS
jgi:iron(III) transport system permease protein